VLALDVRLDEAGMPCVSTDGWTKTSTKTLWDCIDHYLAIGAKHVLCTDVSRDGALSGPNTPLYAEILRRYPGLKLQASGGVRGIDDVRCIASTGASGVITGRAMLDGLITAEEMRTFRQSE
jgi:phosphoribosylformimino-5-aminoimidazole carboxamide ribotide isomerase